ncbi:Di-sulfide bridge nucleocytoplasmic transport domain-containing protein [Emericellopsis atlantica]|uniref:Di-sulfide bridge nucleocytoplasmic transport domain-containing protein n=1 Tax=Emericellopsis atlantica TaxID=2614577 RepID=A0A9P8CP01_9HYPO|nr:Di-sulfide bridge nucleocytoplasmic transport domain-containing protein [Emericellopsis atlantica]KAG9254038.1 Di-sulfide bridge nucleocytoplasmic transport domain-containing protein [Emericellopsis atlantica]
MQRRTYEGHMDWQYDGHTGPVDESSPFVKATANRRLNNGFASPSKGSDPPKPFSTPSKPLQPQRKLFTPLKATSTPPAPPFRNPAFTTPRKPFDEQMLSEASGAEDSPAQASDYPNDTPEADRMDIHLSPVGPSRVDKATRYKKHAPGKGEIASGRDHGRRKKYDKVPGYMRRSAEVTDDDDDDDSGAEYWRSGRSRSRRRPEKPAQSGNPVGSLFSMMEQHHTAPENIHRWFWLGVNVFITCSALGIGIGLLHALQSDMNNLNEEAREVIRAQKSQCRQDYQLNRCNEGVGPLFQKTCDDLFQCMMKDPEAISKVKQMIKGTADILNEFFNGLSLQTWTAGAGIIGALTYFMTRRPSSPAAPEPPRQPIPTGSFDDAAGPIRQGDVTWIPVQTPQAHRRRAIHMDDTDTDHTPPPLLWTPSRGHRSMSPIKYPRSASKRDF